MVPPTLMPPAALTLSSHIFQVTSCFLASSAMAPVSASGAPILMSAALAPAVDERADRNACGQHARRRDAGLGSIAWIPPVESFRGALTKDAEGVPSQSLATGVGSEDATVA